MKKYSNTEIIEELEKRLDVEILVTSDESFEHYEGDDLFKKSLHRAIILIRRIEKLKKKDKKERDLFGGKSLWKADDVLEYLDKGKEWQ